MVCWADVSFDVTQFVVTVLVCNLWLENNCVFAVVACACWWLIIHSAFDCRVKRFIIPSVDSNHQDILRDRDEACDEYRNIVVQDGACIPSHFTKITDYYSVFCKNRVENFWYISVLNPDKPQVIFDAFVCFCEKDLAFVQEMLDVVEDKHKLKLCVNIRDMLPGASTHHVTAKLIADRCAVFS